jgi:lysophospholipid acyltransferase (LPLAT)-like uncharacterized protein
LKKLLRSDGAQALMGWLLGCYLLIVRHTLRWKHENLACIEPVLSGEGGAVGLMWHGRIPLSLGTAPQWERKRTKILVSPSGDGEFIARALHMAGFGTIRASSAKKGDSAKARQAVAAIRQAVTWVSEGGCLVVTPDGPRGPNEVMAQGALQIAKRAGCPVFLSGLAASPAKQLESAWDRVMFPAPFGRGAVVWEGPYFVPADADDAAIDALLVDWAARLSAATRRAEALVGRRGA